MVGPIGVASISEPKIPITAHSTERIAEQRTTCRKERKRNIADSAGKTISAEIRSEPTRFIARTMITAVMTAKKRL